MAVKQEVLCLYRRVLRIARTWQALDPKDSAAERKYIKDEARHLFRKNKGVQNEEDVKIFLQEGEARIEIAKHYRNPYPRPMNIPQNVLPPGGKKKKRRERDLKQARPVYLKSYDDDS